MSVHLVSGAWRSWLFLAGAGLLLPQVVAPAHSASAATVTGSILEKRGLTKKGLSDVAVWLTRAELGAPAPQEVIMDQINRNFVPHVVTVSVGGTVVFRNSDRMEHSVYSQSRTARFFLGQKKQGDKSAIKVTRPGVIDIRCDKHAEMLGWVVVVPSPYHGVTNAKGEFAIPQVPPGTYEAYSWSERYRKLLKASLVVPPEPGRALAWEFTHEQEPH